MRLTIIPEDGFVSIDNKGHAGLDLSFLPTSIHAVQWYGEDGEVEHKDERGRAAYNEEITELTSFQGAIDAWQQAEEAEILLAQQGDLPEESNQSLPADEGN
jgi:hypothetical protein